MIESNADAIVVGGGLVGMAAAITVAQMGMRTIHLAPLGPPDKRTSALMMPAVNFLRMAGLIDTAATLGHPLTQIRIIDATDRLLRAPETLFDSREAGLDAFGWNFANARLLEHFQTVAQNLAHLETHNIGITAYTPDKGVTLSDGTRLNASLIIGADGKKSLIRTAARLPVREHAFTQAALVCDLNIARPIGSTSIEFHYPDGPFTLVPAGSNRANLVWIDKRSVLDEARNMKPDNLAVRIFEKSQHLFGKIELSGSAHVFPLNTLYVEKAGADGVVLVGEAAHAFPPIGAQGLNLGLRDVADLAATLESIHRNAMDWGKTASTNYAKRRKNDLVWTGYMVDTLFRSLLAGILPAQALRTGGLWALKLAPSLRRKAFFVGMGER